MSHLDNLNWGNRERCGKECGKEWMAECCCCMCGVSGIGEKNRNIHLLTITQNVLPTPHSPSGLWCRQMERLQSLLRRLRRRGW